MKVERLNDTQVRFVLTKNDLEERNIKMNELAYGSDKTHQLFQEMMLLAQEEYEFQSENEPLMLEAMRVGNESVIVVVTKIVHDDDEETEQPLNLIPKARTTQRIKRKGLIEPPEEDDPEEDSISVFSFDTLDILASAASRLGKDFEGASQVFKHEGRYFLLVENETPDVGTDDIEAMLSEYGNKHLSNAMAKHYLVEHGETLIGEDAVRKIITYNI